MDTITLLNYLELIYERWGNVLIFIISFLETLPIGFLVPGGLVVSLGGFYSYGEKTNLIGVVISSTLGMLLAFLVGYLAGRKTGFYLVKKFKQEKNALLAKNLLENQGAVILTTSLLSNLTRFWIAYVAGVEKYNIFRFIFYGTIASLTWNSLFVMIGYLAGSEREKLESGLGKLGILSYGIVVIAILVITWSIKKEFKQLKKT